jgi:hypothetical protein
MQVLRQANAALAMTPNLGNVDSFTIGYRWYPIMVQPSRSRLPQRVRPSQDRKYVDSHG